MNRYRLSLLFVVLFALTQMGTVCVPRSLLRVFNTIAANDDAAMTEAGVPVTIRVLENDYWGNNFIDDSIHVARHSLQATDEEGNGQFPSLRLDSQFLIYTPPDGFSGTATFEYTLRGINIDINIGIRESSATVTLTVCGEPAGAGDDPCSMDGPQPLPEDCGDLRITVTQGRCVEFKAPCPGAEPMSAFFAALSAPSGLYTRVSGDGTVRELCAACDAETRVDDVLEFSLIRAGQNDTLGVGRVTLSVTVTAARCDDGNLCTTDLCDEAARCVHLPMQCPAGEACDPASGACVPSATPECTSAADCDDGIACTTDSCDAQQECVNAPVVCPPDQTCDPATGACVTAGDPAGCESDEECGPNAVCIGLCHLLCSTNDDCPAGQICEGCFACFDDRPGLPGCLAGATAGSVGDSADPDVVFLPSIASAVGAPVIGCLNRTLECDDHCGTISGVSETSVLLNSNWPTQGPVGWFTGAATIQLGAGPAMDGAISGVLANLEVVGTRSLRVRCTVAFEAESGDRLVAQGHVLFTRPTTQHVEGTYDLEAPLTITSGTGDFAHACGSLTIGGHSDGFAPTGIQQITGAICLQRALVQREPRPLINLELRPSSRQVDVGRRMDLALYAASDDGTNRRFSAIEVILRWDPSVLALQATLPPNPNPWRGAGFLADDPGGLNESIPPRDGVGLWAASDPFDGTLIATPEGVLLTRFRFDALAESADTRVEIVAMAGDPPTETSVSLRITTPTDLTGCLGQAVIRVDRVPGDCDRDGDVDLSDFLILQSCFTGPEAESLPGDCECADFDGDRDIDLADLVAFQVSLALPGS